MAVNNNADDYAATRQNMFFPANNTTPADGNLTGQCVTLVKWFFAEMCNGFPAPFAARGDARYVGANLVAQGLAVEVPYASRQRGDIVCLEYGTYGHIYVQLSGGRVLEENINWPGVATKVVDGATVHASRIGSEGEAWRAGLNPHVYRLKSYAEPGAQPQGDSMVIQDADNWYGRFNKLMVQIRGRSLSRDEFRQNFVGVDDFHMVEILSDNPEADAATAPSTQDIQNFCSAVYKVQADADDLAHAGQPWHDVMYYLAGKYQTKIEPVGTAQTQIDAANQAADTANKSAQQLQDEKAADEQTGNSFLRWLGDQLNKLKGSS